MVERVALRLPERAYTGVLRKRLQKLAIADQRLVEQRLRMIGKHVIERIGDAVGAEQLVPKSEIRRRQLIVGHTALSVVQVLPLAAEIPCLDEPIAGQFPLESAVPLLSHRRDPVIEVALANARADVRQCTAGRSLFRSQGQIQSQREWIGHGRKRYSAPVH